MPPLALTARDSGAQVNLDGFALPVKKLKGTEPVDTLDLSDKNLKVASAVVIASLIGVNGSLTKIDLSRNFGLGYMGGKAALRKAVEGRSGFELVL